MNSTQTKRVEPSSTNNESNWAQLNQSSLNARSFGTGSTCRKHERYTDYTIHHDLDTSIAAAEFISVQYTHAYSLMAFELASSHESFVQSCVLKTITISQSACWSLFIGAKVYQATRLGYGGRSIKPYIQILDQLDGQISTTEWKGMIARELSGWLLAALELVDLRFLIDPQLAYKTLYLAIPIFMHMAQTEPAIWRGRDSGPSLHSVLLSNQTGLARLATVDIVGSFIFGFPQTIMWDPTFIPELARLQWDEWLPGCPLCFVLVLCKINTWRNQDPHTRNLDEWVQYEHNVLDWRPGQICRLDSSGSWRAVGRLAIQEAFRHMTLIYLYMGLGTFGSGDPHVQASCGQISQLCSLVDSNPNLAVHFFFPAIVAGICSRDEKHRSVLWKCVTKAETCKSFLFKGVGFSKALDHLWRGSASNGAEVAWQDYLTSSQRIIKMTR
ncbi:unnamed protein product [Rhizoctonia solani]|uniref:Uncharacterized protein n=1 Tax=Rhizoctonia solani TaxID=456999 RepID=A0A8H3GJG3_9AGAM|nr:unnamed protein product [Rhizoctonia solani]